MSRSDRNSDRGPASSRGLRGTASAIGLLSVCLAAAIAVAGCGSSEESATATGSNCDNTKALAAIKKYEQSGEVLSKGPYGEPSASAESIKLTPSEIAEVKAKHATVAIVMHFSGDTWSNAQVAALTKEFGNLGIKVVAHTDAEGKASKQFSDIESVLALHPDLMVSIPSLDPVALAPAYKKAAQEGVKIVFMESVAQGMHPGEYVSNVAVDNYGAGAIGADQMAADLCGKGTVGVVYHAAEAPTNKLRREGFENTIKADYPEIEITQSKGLLGPNWSNETSEAVNAWLTKESDLSGVWCFFDAPCEGAIEAARSVGRTDLVTNNVDLGSTVSLDMASNEFVKAIAAARPYDQGTIEARLAAYSLIGKKAPPFVALPAVPVVRENLAESWETVYHEPAPSEITEALSASE